MKISEVDIIRFLVDLIDNQGDSADAECEPEQCDDERNTLDDMETESPMDRDDVFIPPLQAKLEMMKLMTGVEQKNQELLGQADTTPIGAPAKKSVAASLLAALDDDPFEG